MKNKVVSGFLILTLSFGLLFGSVSVASASDSDLTSSYEVHRGEETTFNAIVYSINNISLCDTLNEKKAEYTYHVIFTYSEVEGETYGSREYIRYVFLFCNEKISPNRFNMLSHTYSGGANAYSVYFNLYLDDNTIDVSTLSQGVMNTTSYCGESTYSSSYGNSNMRDARSLNTTMMTATTYTNIFYYSYAGGNYYKGLVHNIWTNYDIYGNESGLLMFRANLLADGSDIGLSHELVTIGANSYYRINFPSAPYKDYGSATVKALVDYIDDTTGLVSSFVYEFRITNGEYLSETYLQMSVRSIVNALKSYNHAVSDDNLDSVVVSSFVLELVSYSLQESQKYFYSGTSLNLFTGDAGYDDYDSSLDMDYVNLPSDVSELITNSSLSSFDEFFSDCSDLVDIDYSQNRLMSVSSDKVFELCTSLYLQNVTYAKITWNGDGTLTYGVYDSCFFNIFSNATTNKQDAVTNLLSVFDVIFLINGLDSSEPATLFFTKNYYIKQTCRILSDSLTVQKNLQGIIEKLYEVDYAIYKTNYNIYNLLYNNLGDFGTLLAKIDSSTSSSLATLVRIEDAINSLSLSGGGSSGDLIDFSDLILPDWLQAIYDFYSVMIPVGDEVFFQPVVSLFEYYIDTENGWLSIDTDSDGYISDENSALWQIEGY